MATWKIEDTGGEERNKQFGMKVTQTENERLEVLRSTLRLRSRAEVVRFALELMEQMMVYTVLMPEGLTEQRKLADAFSALLDKSEAEIDQEAADLAARKPSGEHGQADGTRSKRTRRAKVAV